MQPWRRSGRRRRHAATAGGGIDTELQRPSSVPMEKQKAHWAGLANWMRSTSAWFSTLVVSIFLRQDYEQALSVFSDAAESVRTASRVRSSERFKVYINLSRTHHSLQNYAEADRYFARAREIDPEAVQEFSYIATAGGDSAELERASEVGRVEPSLFFGEE